MHDESFEHLEPLFHQLRDLAARERDTSLAAIDAENPGLAASLRALLDASEHERSFLDAAPIDAAFPPVATISVDGSVVIGGRYTIRELIGIGGSSSVFRASMANPDRDVAVKMLRVGLESDRSHASFSTESIVQASLPHPHIAHIYETGIQRIGSTDVPWIAMELVDSTRSIADVARDPTRSAEENERLFLQVLDAVRAAHAQGVLHLDLNASNILVDTHGFPKIIDFGLAAMASRGRPTSTPMGTRLSMAPEQLDPEVPALDERTDIYALALVYVELVVGIRLQEFDRASNARAFEMIRAGRPQELLASLEGIDANVRGLLWSMLAIDPQARPATTDDVAAVFQHRSAPMPRAKGRSRGPIVATALVCVLAVLLVWTVITPTGTVTSPSGDTLLNPSGSALSLSSDLAISLAEKNPRGSSYAPMLDRVIDEIAASLESSETMPASEAAPLHASLADRYELSGRFDASIRQYNRAIDAYERAGDARAEQRTRLDLVDVLLFLGRTDGATRVLAPVASDQTASADMLVRLSIANARLLHQHGERSASLEQLSLARSRVDETESKTDAWRVERFLELADIAAAMKYEREQLDFLKEAARCAQTAASTHPQLEPIVAIASAKAAFDADELANHERPIAIVTNSIAQLDEIGDTFHASWARRQLGHMLRASNKTDAARSMYTEAAGGLRDLLGPGHHETRVAEAYLQLASDNERAYCETLNELGALLGRNHPAVSRLRDERDCTEPAH